jgi:hypothetical protein
MRRRHPSPALCGFLPFVERRLLDGVAPGGLQSTFCGVRRVVEARRACRVRFDQPPSWQKVGRRSLIVRYRGGPSAAAFFEPPARVFQPGAGRYAGGRDSDSFLHSMPGVAWIDVRAAFPGRVAETANAPLDMTAAVVEATRHFTRPARQFA